MIFTGRDILDENGEFGGGGGLPNFTAQATSQGVELRGGQFARVALRQLGLDAAQLFPQRIDAIGGGRQPFFTEGFEFNRLEVLNQDLVFAAPVNEGRLAHLEFGFEPGIAPALGAQRDKALNRLIVVHNRSFPGPSRQATVESAPGTAKTPL